MAERVSSVQPPVRISCDGQLPETTNWWLRPIPAIRFSQERPVSTTQVLRTGVLRSGRWRPHPIGQFRTVAMLP